MSGKPVIILGIESSCDDTGAAIIKDGKILANVVAGQKVHLAYGGVVPELASRAHQQHIVPVISEALKQAGVQQADLSAIAFTRGPGLLGSLLVGTSFAKALALAHQIPLIEVNHMMGHVFSLFIADEKPSFPFLCLTVSGGHTQIVLVKDYLQTEILGETIDDAAGEAFDKAAKIMNLPYPGGPLIDQLAQKGNPLRFSFAKPNIPELNFSFSGLKTSFLYFLQDQLKADKDFVEKNKEDLCASLQHTIIQILIQKLEKAATQTGIKQIGIAGGVSANSGLRKALELQKEKLGWNVFIPELKYCTDNAGMIAMTAYFKFLKGEFTNQGISATARYGL